MTYTMEITFKIEDPYNTKSIINRNGLIDKLKIKLSIIEEEILKNRKEIVRISNDIYKNLFISTQKINDDLDNLVCLNTCLDDLVCFYKQIIEQQNALNIKNEENIFNKKFDDLNI